jgi:hypothetical protein
MRTDARAVGGRRVAGPRAALGTVEDQTSVMRVWTRRYHDLGRLRTQLLCRLHAVLCEVVPGGFRKELPAGQAIAILDSIVAQSPVTQTKLELARDLVVDLQRLDAQRRDARRRTGGRSPPRARRSPTSTVSGPITAGAVLGYVRDVHASPTGTTSPPITAPRRSRSPPATGRSTGFPGAGTGSSTTPSTWPRSPRSATTAPRAAPTTRRRLPKG